MAQRRVLPSSRARRRWRREPHTIDEVGIARIRPKGITPGHRQAEQLAVPKPVGCFQPLKCCIGVAEARIDHRERERWSLALREKLIELAEKTLGLVPPAKTAIDMPQEGERESLARKAESLLELGNSFGFPALAPYCPPENEVCVKGIWE